MSVKKQRTAVQQSEQALSRLQQRRGELAADLARHQAAAVQARRDMGAAIVDGGDVMALTEDLARKQQHVNGIKVALAAVDEQISDTQTAVTAARRQLSKIEQDELADAIRSRASALLADLTAIAGRCADLESDAVAISQLSAGLSIDDRYRHTGAASTARAIVRTVTDARDKTQKHVERLS